MRIAVGCPVFERAWVLDRWFDSVESQDLPGDIEYHFVLTPGDDATHEVIFRRAGWRLSRCIVDGEPGFRDRDPRRYHLLADLRNKLLGSVRESGPDFFLSWDSDMLFEPGVLRSLFMDKPVVGALVDMLGEDWLMERGVGFPSYMTLLGDGSAERLDEALPTGPLRVGVVMGTVLMRREVYERVEYADHSQGEDIAFALACEAAGFERWLQPAARGVHLHDRDVQAAA